MFVSMPYQRRVSSAVSSAPSGGGDEEAPGDWGSLWTPNQLEGAPDPGAARAAHA